MSVRPTKVNTGVRTQRVFTTGQIARLCRVAPRTVSKWFDSGKLKGYRIPGSQDRRVPREHLMVFLKEYGMPLEALDVMRIVAVGLSSAVVQSIRDAGYDVAAADDPLAAIGQLVGRPDAAVIASGFGGKVDGMPTVLVAGGYESAESLDAARAAGCVVVEHSAGIGQIVGAIADALRPVPTKARRTPSEVSL